MTGRTDASKQVLVVEDDSDIAALVTYHFTREGYQVRTARSGPEALEAVARERPDLVVLDLMLPGLPGLDVLEAFRKRPRVHDVPVIVLTARREEPDRIRGLELGADDYMTKPFSPRELVLRAEAVLKRTQSPPVARSGRIIKSGPVTVDLDALRAAVDDHEVRLTPTEFRLLSTLLERRGRVQTASNCSKPCGTSTSRWRPVRSTCTSSACAPSSEPPATGSRRYAGSATASAPRSRPADRRTRAPVSPR